ncbi:hypothetical protein AHAS_Ahas01G0093700 [Arachis hypogaea]
MRQFRYAQPATELAKVIRPKEHCITLRGVQLHDWRVLHAGWIEEWDNCCNTQLQDLHPLLTWDYHRLSTMIGTWVCSEYC